MNNLKIDISPPLHRQDFGRNENDIQNTRNGFDFKIAMTKHISNLKINTSPPLH